MSRAGAKKKSSRSSNRRKGGGTPRIDGAFFLSAHGWPYLLVPFIPVAVALELAHSSATLVFVCSALGIIPTAALMGRGRASSG